MITTIAFWIGVAALLSSAEMMLDQASWFTIALLLGGWIGGLAIFFRTITASTSASRQTAKESM